jgi:hypothetical protein
LYVRIARFEGLDASRMDEQAAQMKRDIDAARAGDSPPEFAEQLEKLRGSVRRFYYLVDRQAGTALGLTISDTEDDVRRADAALNEMSSGEGQGRRTSVEIYEALLDETFG